MFLDKEKINKIKKLVNDGYQVKTKTKAKMNLVTLKACELFILANDQEFTKICSINYWYDSCETWIEYIDKNNNLKIDQISDNEMQKIVKIIMGNKFVERNGQ